MNIADTSNIRLLVTGGTGFVGSHTIAQLLTDSRWKHADVVIIDNLSNSHRGLLVIYSSVSLNEIVEVINRLRQITGRTVTLFVGDITLQHDVDAVFEQYGPFDAVLHFAALKSVAESIRIPLEYYKVNIAGTITLLQSMERHGCFRLVVSSSAAVYTGSKRFPAKEEQAGEGYIPSPYGWSKWCLERSCMDAAKANPRWRAILLRYFNPAGAHSSGLIGEDPRGVPMNLAPFVAQVAIGLRDRVSVFGGDWDTPDGTCVRDYIHIMDLADGHVRALDMLFDSIQEGQVEAFNLGTGTGYSVLDVIHAMQRASQRDIPYEVSFKVFMVFVQYH